MADDKIFKSLVYCGNCGKKYVIRKEGGNIKYVCGTSHRTGKCERNAYTEWELVKIISEHCFKNSIVIICSASHMKEIISKIVIYDKETYTIEFSNGKICGWTSPTTLTL